MKKILIASMIATLTLQAGFLDSVMETVASKTNTSQSVTKENQTLINSVKEETGLNTTQSVGALGTLLAYAGNNTTQSDYSKVTNSVPGLSSLTNTSTISPLVNSITSSEMVQTTLKTFGVEPSLVQTIAPILVNYVSSTGGEESGNIIFTALSGLLK